MEGYIAGLLSGLALGMFVSDWFIKRAKREGWRVGYLQAYFKMNDLEGRDERRQ